MNYDSNSCYDGTGLSYHSQTGEEKEDVFGVPHDPELGLNSYKVSTIKIQLEKSSCLLQMGKLKHRLGKY